MMSHLISTCLALGSPKLTLTINGIPLERGFVLRPPIPSDGLLPKQTPVTMSADIVFDVDVSDAPSEFPSF
jgi:hypothetical protein